MKRMLKKFLSIIISVFIVLQLMPMFVFADNLIIEHTIDNVETDVTLEEKVCCTATLEDDFSDDCVLVVIDHANSIIDRVFTASDFPEVDVKTITYLTSPITPLFEESETEEEVQKKAEILALTNVEEFNHIIRIELNVKGKKKVLEAIRILETFDFVISAEPNYVIKIGNDEESYDLTTVSLQKESALSIATSITSVTNDSDINKQYALERIQAINAWSITTGSKNIRVGIIDSGISTHSDLVDNLADGWDFYNENSKTDDDKSGHGTKVAGIIGAVGNNGEGISGINWNITLVPLQVLIPNNPNYNFSGDAIIEAIEFARENDIPIINCSFGLLGWNAMEEILKTYKGLAVCSAGNDGIDTENNIHYPSGFDYDNIISVAASNKADDSLYETSNYGVTTVDLAAPGELVWSTNKNNGYGYIQQTSCAAPHVAGVAALILSVRPELSAEQVKACILNGVDKVDALEGKCVTGGRLNAYKAVQYALSYPADQMVSGDFDGDGKEDVASIVSLMGYGGANNSIEIQVTRGGTDTSVVWHSTTKFNGTKIQGRVTAGDFNGDGKDDIAVMYDYDNNQPKILVFLSTGSSFQNWTAWHLETGFYNPERITGRFTAGDFNGDGKDDIATMYDYANHTAKILVFISNGSSFNTWTPWFIEDTPYYYNPSNVAGRFEAGDFNGDGKDDIATLYYYANETTKIHVFLSQGNTFSWFQSWYSQMNPRYYNCDNVLDRFEVADFNGDGKDDVATMYNYGSGTMQLHVFTSTGSALNNWSTWYNRNATGTYYADTTTAFLACDANGDGKSDIASRYNYRNSVSSLLYFKSTGSSFNEFTKWVKAL